MINITAMSSSEYKHLRCLSMQERCVWHEQVCWHGRCLEVLGKTHEVKTEVYFSPVLSRPALSLRTFLSRWQAIARVMLTDGEID